MPMKIAFLCVASFLLALATAATGEEPTSLVIPGAGFTGTYDTEIVLGNPYDVDLNLIVFPLRLSSQYAGCMFNECPPPQPMLVTLKANGQGVFHYSDAFPMDVAALYVGEADESDFRLPVARARVYAVGNPGRAMELPINTYATLVARSDAALVFVGAQHSRAAYSNLVVLETSHLVDSDVDVRIEAVDQDGHAVGSIERSIVSGHSIFLVNVVGQMGIPEFSGQIRVTRVGGTGVIDGILATQTTDGGYAISSGFNP